MNARQTDNTAARGNADAAWLVGWWQGKVVGIVIILIASMAVIGFVLFKKKKNDTEE